MVRPHDEVSISMPNSMNVKHMNVIWTSELIQFHCNAHVHAHDHGKWIPQMNTCCQGCNTGRLDYFLLVPLPIQFNSLVSGFLK